MTMNKIRYQLIAPDLFGEVLNLYTYSSDDPVSSSLGCSSQWQELNQSNLENLKEGMSWCAIDESTGEIVGMIISCEISLDSLPNARLKFDQYMELGLSRELVLILILCDCILNSNLKQMMLDYKVTEMIKLHSLRVHPSYRN